MTRDPSGSFGDCGEVSWRSCMSIVTASTHLHTSHRAFTAVGELYCSRDLFVTVVFMFV